MSTNAVQELTLHLPQQLIERLSETADGRQQSVEQVVTEILTVSVPPLKSQAANQMREKVERLSALSETELRANAAAQLPSQEQSRLSELLSKNREGNLSSKENEELEILLDTVESVAVQKATARWLLQSILPSRQQA